MVLLHGGSPKGAERIAARWADHRKVPQIAFKPDWSKHAKAAPFKRNDQMLDVLPIGVIVFPGTGIQENLGRQGTEARHPRLEIRQRRRVGCHLTHLTHLAHNVRIELVCAGVTVSGRKKPPLSALTKRTEIGWPTDRLCSKVHCINRSDRQSRRRSKEALTCWEKMKTRPS